MKASGSDDRYVAGFLAGQAVAYCEMVTRGVRLAGQLDVPLEARDTLVALIGREGCLARVIERDTDRAAIWIYRDQGVEWLLDALETSFPTPNAIAIWGMGKLLGYGNQDVMTFLASTSTSPAESSPRPCLDMRCSDTA